MEEKIRQLLRRAAYPYLLILWFLVFKSAECFYSFSIVLFFCFLGAFSLLMFAAIWFFSGVCGIRWARIFLSLALLLLFFFDPVSLFLRTYLVGFFHVAFHYYDFIPIGIAIWGISIGLARFGSKSGERGNLLLNIFLLIFTGIAILRGFQTYQKEMAYHHHNGGEIAAGTGTGQSKDIVWILMDEYAASPCLQRDFHFDNPLDTFLKQRNYLLLDGIQTRSAKTVYSVNSIFNFDDSIVPANYMYAHFYLYNDRWTEQLRRAGYTVESFDFMDIGHEGRIQNLNIFPATYSEQILYGTLWDMAENLVGYNNGMFDRYNLEVAAKLRTSLADTSSHPRFIWAHFLIPHLPFFRGSHGEILAHPQKEVGEEGPTKEGYIAYVSYGNLMLMDLLKKYPELSNKIVVISGDHGARFPFIHDGDEYFRPYAAVHFPDHFDTAGLESVKYIQQLPAFIGAAGQK